MITLACYIALRCWVGEDWSSWLLLLPVLLDVALIEWVGRK